MENRLIWLDMEMTGLDPLRDRVLEIATLVTDADLNLIAEGPTLAIFQPDEILDNLDDWNTSHHTASGLLDRCRQSALSVRDAEIETLEFLSRYVEKDSSPLCGNSICQDRRFMARWMPELEKFFHYRNLDVSTIKELARRWYPDLNFAKKNQHTALQDIYESLEELRFYRAHVFK